MKDHQRKSSDKDIDGEGMLGGMYDDKKMYISTNNRSIA